MKPATKKHSSQRFHVRGKDREYLISNLAMLLKAGVPAGEALLSLQETTRSRPLQKALAQMGRDIDDGWPLWQALQASGVAGAQTISLIRLGETSGNLIENLRVAATQEQKQRIFRAKVRSALMYPGFVVSLTVIVGLGVAWFLLPRLADTFAQLRVKLPPISQVMVDFGQFLRTDGVWAVPVFIAATGLLLYLLFAAPGIKIIGQTLLFHLPGIGRLLHEVELARFGYLFGTLLQAGLSVTQALQLLADATSARQYRQFYQELSEAFDQGYSFAESTQRIAHRHVLPGQVRQMIIAGERSGSLPDTLQSIGTIYEQKADLSTQNLQTLLEPILLVVVWLGVMGVAVAIILPIYSLVGGLGV